MKRIIAVAVTIAACGALCTLVWHRNDVGEEVNEGAASQTLAKLVESPVKPDVITMVNYIELSSEKEDTVVAASESADTPVTELTTTPVQQTATITADLYRTDVYPNNIYSEEYLYDADGNLIVKTTTIPTAFGPDTVWIDGHAYYDVPGFGLVEWSGPGQRTEDYTMYESGVKIGSMGGEAESSTPSPAPTLPEPTGEVIDQTINTCPEKSSTPPDYKPEATPPAN